MSSSSSISLLLCIILSLTSLFTPAQAIDTLTPGQSLRDGNSLISAGNVFDLGFFSPSNSMRRYLGIWYHDSSDTVIWVANREAPVPDKSGSLTISADGNLVLVDGANSILWSSNASSLSPNQTVARLSDVGNLQLNSSSQGVVWQSYDYRTDSYLPTMTLGFNLATNVSRVLTSWKNKSDPAVGKYSMGMDPAQLTQIYIWEGAKPRWRSGRWNGQVFNGIDRPMYLDGFQISYYEGEGKMFFHFSDPSVLYLFVLTWDGILEQSIWENDTQVWYKNWAEPATVCELYNKCGNYGSCTDENTPMCTCLQGFVPKSIDEWKNGNWTSGCIRRTPLQCEKNISSNAGQEADGFVKLERVKVPDLSFVVSNTSNIYKCEQTCVNDCWCKGYTFVTGIGCLIWHADLVDIHMLSSGGNEFYLRLAGSELDNNKKKNAVAIVIVMIVLAIIISIGCIYLVWKYRKTVKAFIKLQKDLIDGRIREPPNDHFGDALEIKEEGQGGRRPESPLLNFDSILAATGNFSLSNLLGKGGFGPVYKGTLPDGQEIAVKRLSRSSGQGLEEFKNEVILISKLQHRNLVRLLGYCFQGEEKILIYEYMPNRSLDAFLFDTMNKVTLDWKKRYNIIEGIARGLLYLHRDSRLRVIHRDLKVSNILLDEDMNPKISDFGLARIFRHDDNETNTKRVVGTYGYMSPEYAMQGVFSIKSDVYSFGVLLHEIVSGKKNSTYDHPETSLSLLPHAWKLWNEGTVMEFVDPLIRDSCSPTEVSRCIHVGLLCVQDRANDRPTVPSVVAMLESGSPILTWPRQPTFAAERTPNEVDRSMSVKLSATGSFTTLTGR